MELILFGTMAAVTIGSSLAMIAHRNAVYSALFMVITFASTAVLFVKLEAPFIAAIQILVYAGAVVVLFLFVIMFLSIKEGMLAEPRRGPIVLAFVLAGLTAGNLAAVVASGSWAGGGVAPVPAEFGSVAAVAKLLFTRYLVPFEIASVILLIGMVGAVVLARRQGAEEVTSTERDYEFSDAAEEHENGAGHSAGHPAPEPVAHGQEVHR